MRLSRRTRRTLLGVSIAAVALVAAYVTVVRDLPAFGIEKVELEGASSGYSPRLLAELRAAARGMTTLHLDETRLRDIAGRYPAVTSLQTDVDLPTGLTVTVVERPPVGIVEGARGRSVPVSADGTLLDGQPVDRPLPKLPGRASSGRRARRVATATAARIAAAAPAPLAAWLEQVRLGSTGWTVELREGPQVRIGTGRSLEAKWSAAAAVLSTRAARGARYVDVRLPDRPAAGGFPRPTKQPSRPDAAASPEPVNPLPSKPQAEVDASPQL